MGVQNQEHLIQKKQQEQYHHVITQYVAKVGPHASFPSGDATGVMTFALAANQIPCSSIQQLLLLRMILLILVFGTCYGRIYYGAHYISDTIAGICLATICHWTIQYWVFYDDEEIVESIRWYHAIVAHGIFICIGLLRKSNQK